MGVNQLEECGDDYDNYMDHEPSVLKPFSDLDYSDDEEVPSSRRENAIAVKEENEQLPTGSPVVHSVNFHKLWTVADMKAAQEQDPDIRPVLDAKTGCVLCKPAWNQICSESPAAKSYWAE